MDDIFTAARHNDVEMMCRLLQGGVNPNDRDGVGRTALHLCATYGSNETAAILLHGGADCAVQDFENGWTPLHRSLYFGHLKMTLMLLKAGADIGDEMKRETGKVVKLKKEAGRSIRNSKHWTSPIDHDGHSPLDLLSLSLAPYLTDAVSSLAQTEVLAFGKADFALGITLPNADDVLRPRPLHTFDSTTIVQILAAKYHSAAISAEGVLYTWGHGKGGKLGHGDEVTQPFPRPVSFPINVTITQMASAEGHMLAVSASGELYSWGSNRFGQLGHGSIEATLAHSPRRVEALRKHRILRIAAGLTHSICSSSENMVWAWGSNKNGQLGCRITKPDSIMGTNGSSIPLFVNLLNSKNMVTHEILQLAASNTTTLALCRDLYPARGITAVNEVYQWGNGVARPTKVSLTQRRRRRHNSGEMKEAPFDDREEYLASLAKPVDIVQLVAGRHHCAALSSAGYVYTWGFGSDQLGHGPLENNIATPSLVVSLLPENGGGRGVQVSACGDRTCLVTDTGDLFSWGSSDDAGVLGQGCGRHQPLPMRVVGIKNAAAVSAGENHTLVLTATSIPRLPYADIIPVTYTKRLAIPETVSRPLLLASRDKYQYEDEDSPIMGENGNVIPTLQQYCIHKVAQSITMRNVVSAMTLAEQIYCKSLVKFCVCMMLRNLDALLVSHQRMTDFDIFFSEFDEIVKQCDITSQIPLINPLVSPKPLSRDVKSDVVEKTPYRLLRSAKKKLANLEELEAKLKSRIIASVGGDVADVHDASSFLVSPEEKSHLIKKSKLQQQIALLQAQIDREKMQQKSDNDGKCLNEYFEMAVESREVEVSTQLKHDEISVAAEVGKDLRKETVPVKSFINIKNPRKQDFISFEEYQRRIATVQPSVPESTQIVPKKAWETEIGQRPPCDAKYPSSTMKSQPQSTTRNASSQPKPCKKDQEPQPNGISLAAFLPTMLHAATKQTKQQRILQKSWASTSSATSPLMKCSLKDIQKEEEVEKQQSTLKELKGNTVPWLIDRRSMRAGSLEDVMRVQEEEKRKQDEERELQAALALIRKQEKKERENKIGKKNNRKVKHSPREAKSHKGNVTIVEKYNLIIYNTTKHIQVSLY